MFRPQPRRTPRLFGAGRRRRRRRGLAAAAGLVLVAGIAPAATAFGFGTTQACAARSESTPYQRWGDSARYFLFPNGTFENGSTDWLLSGAAQTASENEPYYVAGSGHVRSLRIGSGGRAESRTICISQGEDGIRMLVKNPGVAGAILHVEANVRNPQTGAIGQTSFDVNADAQAKGWGPTMRLNVPNLLGGTGSQELTLVITTRGSSATWSFDDLYIDPFKSY